MKKLATTLLALSLFVSCTSGAIEPVGDAPIPKQKVPLSVWYVTPTSARFKNDGMKISIVGQGFEEGAIAMIGNKACLKTKVKSDTLIRCKMPYNEPGDHPVTVVNPNGQIAPLAYTLEEIEALDEEDAGTDGLVYFYYVKPIRR